MKDILTYCSLLFLLTGLADTLSAQYVYTIKADSVKITNCDSSELIIENHTQDTLGFLFNTGNGRTIFKHGLIKLNDSLYLSGVDTLNLRNALKANNGLSVSGGSIVLGNNVGDTSAALTSNRVIPIADKTISLNGTDPDNHTTLGPGTLNVQRTLTGDISNYQSPIQVAGNFDFSSSTPHVIPYLASAYFTSLFAPNGTVATAGSLSTCITIAESFTPYATGNFSYTALNIIPYYDFTNYSTSPTLPRDVRGIYYSPSYDGTIPHRHIAYENTNGDNIFNSGTISNQPDKGKAGFQGVTAPTASVHIGAGTAAAGSAPLKINSGVLLTTPENGAIEYDGNDLYLTKSNTRYKLVKALTGQLSTNFGGASLSAASAVTATVSVTGVLPGDVVSVNANSGSVNPPQIIITAFVTTANTVTIQAFNAGSTSVTPATDTYKVKILQ